MNKALGVHLECAADLSEGWGPSKYLPNCKYIILAVGFFQPMEALNLGVRKFIS